MGGPVPSRRPLNPTQRAALEALIQDCAPRLVAYVRHLHSARIDAEEVVAETFCRAVANCQKLFRADRPDLYLLRIARNLCHDHLRRLESAGGVTAGLPAGLVNLTTADPPGELLRTERDAVLRAAVAELPLEQREVVILRLSTGLKFEEIAALLELPLGTVLWRMHAALKALRERIEVRL